MTSYYHVPFPGNPHKNGVVDIKRDVPSLPIKLREEQERQNKKLLGMGGRL